MSNIFFTADTHMGHAKIIEYCSRPFTGSVEMDEGLISNWNAIVKPEDLTFHLGDFSFKPANYRHKLNGKIILIRGNHDSRKTDNLFDKVINKLELNIGKYKCFLSHRPGEIFAQIGLNNFLLGNPLCNIGSNFDYYINGHVHNIWKVKEKNINVGIDVWNMKPVPIEDLIKLMDERYEETKLIEYKTNIFEEFEEDRKDRILSTPGAKL